MLLALGHKARQGKDTAGEAIVEHFNNRRTAALNHSFYKPVLYPEARIFKFADALYKVCREEYGMTEKDAPLLQKIGDGRREEFGHDYWINQLAPQIKAFEAEGGIAVITDVRYTNEGEWVKANNGHMINVRRLLLDGTQFITDDRDPNFISEVQLDNFNYEYYIISKFAAYTAEQAITTAEFIRAIERG